MADKMSKLILPIKSGNTIAPKEFDVPGGTQLYKTESVDVPLPVNIGLDRGSAVVYNNEIHIFSLLDHYKWDGSSWSKVSTLPYKFYYGRAVVYNNEIHIIICNTIESTNGYHYKWDGTSWTELSAVPYGCYGGSVVVYNNRIYVIGGVDGYISFYEWNGTSWTKRSEVPYAMDRNPAVVYKNELHIFPNTNHQKWNGSADWVKLQDNPYVSTDSCSVVYNNEIHLLGGAFDPIQRLIVNKKHYKWNGNSWTELPQLPYQFADGAAVVYNNEIHILGGGDSSDGNQKKHYKWNGTSWVPNSVLVRRDYDQLSIPELKALLNS